jgi:hypothetical protein
MESTTPLDLNTDPSAEDFDQAIDQLYRTTKWMKFLSVFGFIGSGLIALFGLITLAAPGGRGIIMTLVCLLVAILLFIPCRFLYKYARGVQEYVESPVIANLEEAFNYYRIFWMYNGIMFWIYLALTVIGGLVGLNGKSFTL